MYKNGCSVCNIPSFKSKQSLQRHLSSKKHMQIDKQPVDTLFQCSSCNKYFFGRDGLSHHKKICPSRKNDNDKMQNNIDYLTEKFEKEKEELTKVFEKQMEKMIQICSKNNINTQNNCKNQTNYNIHINTFGKENLDYITNDFLQNCVNKIYDSVPTILQKIHFDPEHPENHNIKVTNKKLPHASIMTDDNQWKLVNKHEVIEDMIDKGYNMIDETFRHDPSKYTEERRRNYRKYQDKYDNEDKETIKRLKNEVEYMVFNNSKQINKKTPLTA